MLGELGKHLLKSSCVCSSILSSFGSILSSVGVNFGRCVVATFLGHFDSRWGLLDSGLCRLHLLKNYSHSGGVVSNGLILRNQFAIDYSSKNIELSCEVEPMGLVLFSWMQGKTPEGVVVGPEV